MPGHGVGLGTGHEGTYNDHNLLVSTFVFVPLTPPRDGCGVGVVWNRLLTLLYWRSDINI